MRNRTFAIIFALMILSIFGAACSSGAATPTISSSSASSGEGATLVQERCSVCHDLSRVESSHYTAAGWQTVVDQMIANGAHLTTDEETVVVNWLAANYGP